MYGQSVNWRAEFKYLELALNHKILWNKHVPEVTNRTKKFGWCAETLKEKTGDETQRYYFGYIQIATIMRPSITYLLHR